MKPVRRTLEEDDIKRAALKFLKSHYRNRDRLEEKPTIAALNMQAAGGIQADGYLKYHQADGRPFLATFEATSHRSRDEVLYRVHKHLLRADSLTFASIATTVAFVFWFLSAHPRFYGDYLLLNLGLVLLFFLACYLLWLGLARRARRYRYIYAIEQFKQYHADEQWVALASDVFSGSNDPYFQELRRQCVLNGFGLVIFDPELRWQVIATPTRKELFRGERRRLQFFSRENLKEGVRKVTPGGWLDRLRGMRSAPWNPYNYLRFQRRYFHQWVLVSMSVLVVGVVVWRESRKVPVLEVDPETYERVVRQTGAPDKKEPPVFIVDTLLVGPEGPLNRTSPQAAATPPPREELPREAGFALPDAEAGWLFYPCERLAAYRGTYYAVEESRWDDLHGALKRAAFLNQRDLVAAVLNLACLGLDDGGGYIVFLGAQFYENVADAQRQMELATRDAALFEVPLGELEVLPVSLPTSE